MINKTVIELMKAFPRSFINCHGEFIAHEEANEYFNVGNCKDELEVKCKVLEWLSRGASKGMPFGERKSIIFRRFLLKGINDFLKTNFSEPQMKVIYCELGNQVNRKLTIEFINSGYDFKTFE